MNTLWVAKKSNYTGKDLLVTWNMIISMVTWRVPSCFRSIQRSSLRQLCFELERKAGMYKICPRSAHSQINAQALSGGSGTHFACVHFYDHFDARSLWRGRRVRRSAQALSWFPSIPTKFRENLDEKSPILDDFSNISQKSQKITEILQISKKNLQILNLERCKGLWIL